LHQKIDKTSVEQTKVSSYHRGSDGTKMSYFSFLPWDRHTLNIIPLSGQERDPPGELAQESGSWPADKKYFVKMIPEEGDIARNRYDLTN
jgi:hypothetical protein